MEEQIKTLVSLLSKKYYEDDLTQREEGMKDILDLIYYQDGYGIDAIIENLKDK